MIQYVKNIAKIIGKKKKKPVKGDNFTMGGAGTDLKLYKNTYQNRFRHTYKNVKQYAKKNPGKTAAASALAGAAVWDLIDKG